MPLELVLLGHSNNALYGCLLDQQCVIQGKTYEHNTRWRDNDCTECTCTDGVVVCDEIVCPVLNCGNPLPPAPGECCPICCK